MGAHDALHGLINCYGPERHCPQDTLVFGVVSEVTRGQVTLSVQKVLRGHEDVGKGIRLRRADPRLSQNPSNGGEPGVGDGVLVTYLRQGRMPFRSRYWVRSATTDWRTMRVATDRPTGDTPAIERFVRSGGVDDRFLFVNRDTYLRRSDGSAELIHTSPAPGPALPSPPTPSPDPRPGPPVAFLAGVALLPALLPWWRRMHWRHRPWVGG